MARTQLFQVDPTEHVNIVGSTFAKRERQTLLHIGSKTYNRWTLGRMGCPHPGAALRLQSAMHELGIRTIDSLAKHINEVGQFKGMGTVSYWLALSVLADHGYDMDAVHGEPVTFSTLKTRAKKAARKRPAKRPRRAGPPSEAAGATA